ncbi:lipase family protein [Xanthobacter sp. KR7-225]|uniref:lipase family protein n=1 Tax=Xanthobacter sp. KR7-225 TaxID=3156613 RepID=UPI0032B4D1B7
MTGVSLRLPQRSHGFFAQAAMACVVLIPATLLPIEAGAQAQTGSQSQIEAPRKGPDGLTFYDPPASTRPGQHGDLVWASEITAGVPGAKAWKIMYWSSTLDGQPVPVSGLLIAPTAAAPAGGRPIISWAHGTAGIPRNCAPSMVDNPARDATFYFLPNSSEAIDFGVPALTRLIDAGYVVVATDYNGLGAPGIHQYLIGRTEARNVLDAAIAARQVPEVGAGLQAVVMGWSQGGQAAVWAAQIADYAADRMKVIGAVALAPVNVAEQIKVIERMVASGQQLREMEAVERTMGWYAMTVTYPELKLSDVLTSVGLEFFAEAARAGQCNHHMGDTYTYTESYKGPIARETPANAEGWLRRYEENSLGTVPAQVPVAVFQGDDDVAVAPAATAAYVAKACASGTAISYTHYEATDHIRLAARAQSDFLKWIADRFGGQPAPRTCE